MAQFFTKVSIIIPVYNGSNYLKEAIDSALAQTYKNIEIIVVNDGSNDKGATEKIAKSYGNKIRYVKKKNGGVSTALNLGIKKMTGEYFSWLSHDDLYHPEKIERQVKVFSGLTDKDVMLFADFKVMKGDDKEDVVLDHDMLEKKPKYSLLRSCVNGVTVMLPKNIIDKIGDFDPNLKYTQDYDYWMRVQDEFTIVHLGEVLTTTRIHPKQCGRHRESIIEGDRLWSQLIDWVNDSEKVEYEGSVYGFFMEMFKFILTTPYVETQKKCQEQLDVVGGNIIKEIESGAASKLVVNSISAILKESLLQREALAKLKIENNDLFEGIERLRSDNKKLVAKITDMQKSEISKSARILNKIKKKMGI